MEPPSSSNPMTDRPRLDGALPLDGGSGQDIALAALTRRVAELEHRLDVMKIIVGLVLAGKVLLVVLFIYLVFGAGFIARSTDSSRHSHDLAASVHSAERLGDRRGVSQV